MEPARRVYRSVLTPVGHVVRDRVLRPVMEAARSVGRVTRDALHSVRVTVRQVRQDVRRALLGESKKSDGQDDRILLTKR